MRIEQIDDNGPHFLYHGSEALQIDDDVNTAIARCKCGKEIEGCLRCKIKAKLTGKEQDVLNGWLADTTVNWDDLCNHFDKRVP